MHRALLIAMLVAAASAATTFECPLDESTGKFADPDECDKYWDCFRGEATESYCKDGFAFDPNRVQLAEPCDYIFNVDCTGRELLGEPLGTGVCTRENGIYQHENENKCDSYYSCSDNKPTQLTCSPGLHFNLETKACDWPAAAQRGACVELNKIDEFVCDPSVNQYTAGGQKVAHPRFPHPEDCSKFYVCKNGVEPALSGCDEGLVFSTITNACEDPELVEECADFFSPLSGDVAARRRK